MKRTRNMNMVSCRCTNCYKMAVSIPGTLHRKCGADSGKLRNYSAGSLTRKDLKQNLKNAMVNGELTPAAKAFLKKAEKIDLAGVDRLNTLFSKDNRGKWEACSNSVEASPEELAAFPVDPFYQM